MSHNNDYKAIEKTNINTSTNVSASNVPVGKVWRVLNCLITNKDPSTLYVTVQYDSANLVSNLTLPVDTTISLFDSEQKLLVAESKNLTIVPTGNVDVYFSYIESNNTY